MTKPSKKPTWQPTGGALIAEGVGFQLQVTEMGAPAPPPRRRKRQPPPALGTRSDDDCRELARRQRDGEELGLSEAFVEEWTGMTPATKKALAWRGVRERIASLLADEDDAVAAMATIACELFHGFDAVSWAGFYRVIAPGLLAVGPYQGGHGCLRIPFTRGVCGAAARTGRTQLVEDVHSFPDHIACSATTNSELVVPVFDAAGAVVAVLDLDSDLPAAFDAVDQEHAEAICAALGTLLARG